MTVRMPVIVIYIMSVDMGITVVMRMKRPVHIMVRRRSYDNQSTAGTVIETCMIPVWHRSPVRGRVPVRITVPVGIT